jgi:membrane fusion protein, adhesin transport system
MKPELKSESALSSVSADLVEYSTYLTQGITYTICSLLAVGVAWSYFTNVVEVAAASGTVMPTQHVQVIQSLEGGAVQKIFAKSGDHVVAGQILLALDPTQPGSSRDELTEQMMGHSATLIRLKALLKDESPEFPDEMKVTHPTLVAQSLAQNEAARIELKSSLTSLDEQISQRTIELSEVQSRLATGEEAEQLSAVELATLRKLQKAKAAGRAEVANAQMRYNEIRGQNQQIHLSLPRLKAGIDEMKSQYISKLNGFKSRVNDQLAETEVKLASLKVAFTAQQKRLEQTSIRASTSGIVKSVKATSLGQVIRPGEEVAEIVPEDTRLFIQARVKPEDIAFLREGLSVMVKLSAYDYSIFGSVKGNLNRIAADSTTDERGQIYYLVDIALPQNFISRHGENWPIKSGMVANVEIVTGQRSIFQYITKPIHRMATMSMRER